MTSAESVKIRMRKMVYWDERYIGTVVRLVESNTAGRESARIKCEEDGTTSVVVIACLTMEEEGDKLSVEGS